MKKYIVYFILFCFMFFSCDNLSNSDSKDNEQKTDVNKTEDTVNPIKGKPYIVNGSLVAGTGTTWYVAKIATYTQYFRFSGSTISYQLTRPNTAVGSGSSGTFKYINDEKSEFEYKWERPIVENKVQSKILVLDNDILIVSDGFACGTNSGYTNILYKDLDAYNGVPFMGFGRTGQDGQWFVFTPSNVCYKRYLDLESNELLILQGTWEKTNSGFKIYWNPNNKEEYDLLRGTCISQNAHASTTSIPLNLTVVNY